MRISETGLIKELLMNLINGASNVKDGFEIYVNIFIDIVYFCMDGKSCENKSRTKVSVATIDRQKSWETSINSSIFL